MEIKRNMMWGQWKGARLVIQVGATAFIWGDAPDHPTKGTRYPLLIELLTSQEWLKARRGRWAR